MVIQFVHMNLVRVGGNKKKIHGMRRRWLLALVRSVRGMYARNSDTNRDRIDLLVKLGMPEP